MTSKLVKAGAIAAVAVAIFLFAAVRSGSGSVAEMVSCHLEACEGPLCPVWSTEYGRCYLLDERGREWLLRAEKRCSRDAWEKEGEWCLF